MRVRTFIHICESTSSCASTAAATAGAPRFEFEYNFDATNADLNVISIMYIARSYVYVPEYKHDYSIHPRLCAQVMLLQVMLAAGATSCECELDVNVCRRHDTYD